MSNTPTLPAFRTDRDARLHVAYLRTEAVIDEATARRFERKLDARKRRAALLVRTATVAIAVAEAAVLVGGIVALVVLAAGLPR